MSRVLEEDVAQLVRLWKLASKWKPKDLALVFDSLDCYREQKIKKESVRQFLVYAHVTQLQRPRQRC